MAESKTCRVRKVGVLPSPETETDEKLGKPRNESAASAEGLTERRITTDKDGTVCEDAQEKRRSNHRRLSSTLHGPADRGETAHSLSREDELTGTSPCADVPEVEKRSTKHCADGPKQGDEDPNDEPSSDAEERARENPVTVTEQFSRTPRKSRVQMLLDEESVEMFLSTDQLQKGELYETERGRQRGPEEMLFQRQYSETTRLRHEQIVRQILQEFDLEKCMATYRNLGVYEKKPQGRSVADFRFRSELIRLMGTEIIQISDQSWAGRFQESLREDYEKMLMDKEQNLARAEHDRLHRLHVESIIGDTGAALTRELIKKVKASKAKKGSLSNLPIFKKEDHNIRERALNSRRIKRAYNANQITHEWLKLAFQPEPPVNIDFLQGPGEEEGEEKKDLSAQDIAVADGPRLVPPPAILSLPTANARIRSTVSFADENAAISPSYVLRVLTPEERAEKRHKRYRHLPEAVRQLYEEETVAGLYQLASRLIFTKKKPAEEEDKTKKVVIVE